MGVDEFTKILINYKIVKRNIITENLGLYFLKSNTQNIFD